MAFNIPKPAMTEPNFRVRTPKVKKVSKRSLIGKEPDYIDKIKQLPCCVPGCTRPAPSEPHHLKCADPTRGKGMKVPDKMTVPLCHEHHINGVERVGSRVEAAWFRERGILCLDLAAALYANSHNADSMLSVLLTHKSGGR
jgi:hypothetical protein